MGPSPSWWDGDSHPIESEGIFLGVVPGRGPFLGLAFSMRGSFSKAPWGILGSRGAARLGERACCGRLGHPSSRVMGLSLRLTLALSALLSLRPTSPTFTVRSEHPQMAELCLSIREVPWVRGSSATGRSWGGRPPLKLGGSIRWQGRRGGSSGGVAL